LNYLTASWGAVVVEGSKTLCARIGIFSSEQSYKKSWLTNGGHIFFKPYVFQ